MRATGVDDTCDPAAVDIENLVQDSSNVDGAWNAGCTESNSNADVSNAGCTEYDENEEMTDYNSNGHIIGCRCDACFVPVVVSSQAFGETLWGNNEDMFHSCAR